MHRIIPHCLQVDWPRSRKESASVHHLDQISQFSILIQYFGGKRTTTRPVCLLEGANPLWRPCTLSGSLPDHARLGNNPRDVRFPIRQKNRIADFVQYG